MIIERFSMKIAKSLKLFATTTASTIIMSMTTGCGTDEKVPILQPDNHKKIPDPENQTKDSKFNFKINKIEGSVDINRCGLRCVAQEK